MSIATGPEEVTIRDDATVLLGDFDARGSLGTIIFAHGSGSHRASPRNLQIARHLCRAGFSTLLIDLLTATEASEDELTHDLRFDLLLLGRRVILAIDWVRQQQPSNRPIGLFGASTGAAAAFIAAAKRPEVVRAVVSRGGRADLAAGILSAVRAATLLVVGGDDDVVLRLNRDAYAGLTAATARELVVIPGASHLFEEPGAMEQVARHTIAWFTDHLPLHPTPPSP